MGALGVETPENSGLRADIRVVPLVVDKHNQLHYLVVGLNPIGFSRQTYRYRRDFFDWIEKVPVWRVHQTWDHSAWR